jgi:phosphoribosylanthranilate isomerase
MKPLIKICGITETATLEEITQAKLAIDQLGFVFAESRRKVEPRQWQGLSPLVPEMAKTAGVFVNPSIEDIEEVFTAAPLDIVQLHGEEPPVFCEAVRKRFDCKITKTFSIKEQNMDYSQAVLDLYVGSIDYILLDTASGTERGGTGKTFDWERIAPYQTWSRTHGIPLLVAGGVNADNVSVLLQRYEPDGVDISSGAETNGRKDIGKIRTITERMSQYERSAVE